jgi:poly(A) polymerase
LASLPELRVLQDLAQARRVQVFLVGGTVRELALGGTSPDIDLAVSRQTLELAQDAARALGGTYVLLDEGERTARVVAGAAILDLAEFRGPDLTADLKGRDFTINALALDLAALLAGRPPELIDPLGGRADLAAGRIRMVAAANLADDPLRLLRAYRFAASHGFSVTPETEAAIQPWPRPWAGWPGNGCTMSSCSSWPPPGRGRGCTASTGWACSCRFSRNWPTSKG